MTNEWAEFKAYTDTPVFLADSKQSTAFIGRFTVRMIKQNKGFSRIFTILARGNLFHNADSTLRTDDPYDRTDEALQKIKAYVADAKTERLMITLAEYYAANKEPDSEWVIIPRANISAYLGSASYVDNYEKKIPEGFMEKKPELSGVSAVRINV